MNLLVGTPDSRLPDWRSKPWFVAMLLATLAMAAALLPLAASAHQTSQSYLTLTKEQPSGQQLSIDWDIPLRDLDMVVDLDGNRDGVLTRREVDLGFDAVDALATGSLSVASGVVACRLHTERRELTTRNEIAHARLTMKVDCPAPITALDVDYRLFSDFDASHRGLLSVGEQRFVLVPGAGAVSVSLGALHATQADLSPDLATSVTSLSGFIGSGIHHILIGWDHLAFIIALLIPLLLIPGPHASSPRAIARSMVVTITAFTVAHSITLGLSVTGVIALPAGPIEAMIAVTIVLAAVANLAAGRWTGAPGLAFAFGLIHGFGFANVMQASDATGADLLIGLFGFNVGVEIGQLMFVIAMLPVFWLLRRHAGVQRISASAASLMLVVIGSGWFAERLFDLELIPG